MRPPTQKTFFDARHAAAGLPGGQAGADGHAFGLTVAAAILAARKNDPGLSDDGYASSVARRHHRQDPDNAGQGFYAPFYGARSSCFAVTIRHHLDNAPQLDSAEYDQAIRQVRSKGLGLRRRQRSRHAASAVQPDRSRDRGRAGQRRRCQRPPLALVNATMGDAGILAWDDKYFYDVWRPVVGIREHDPSLGPTAVGGNVLDAGADPGWLPLGAQSTNNVGRKNFAPNFPASPSGHATFGAAAFQSVRCFYDKGEYCADNLVEDLEFVSEELNGMSVDNAGTVPPRHA